ncbi:hypothetical protein MUP01_01455 [Candidatus Bathyarchaeota archaeon]|nr:hypothetical protein [Candidatus Bathyarchaeota archaeon]
MHDWAFAGIVLITLIVTNLVAFIRRGKVSFDIYASDPGYHASWAIGFSMVGTIVGGGMFLAVGQMGYEAGLTGCAIGLATLMGLVLVAVFAPRFRAIMQENNCSTLIQLLEKRFSRRVAISYCLIGGAMYFFLLAGQFVALYVFAQYAEQLVAYKWLPWALTGLAGVSMLFYPVIGGLRKDISTDIFQVVLIVAGVAVLGYAVVGYADKAAVVLLPAKLYSGTAYGVPFLIAVFIFGPGLFLVRMDVWQRIIAAKSSGGVSIAMVSAGLVSLCFYAFFTAIGMVGQATNVVSAKEATLAVIRGAIADPYVLGLIVGAFFACVLSSADTFINNVSVMLVRPLRGKAWRTQGERTSQTQLLVWSRAIAVLSVFGAGLIAFSASDFVDLIAGAFTLLLIFLPTMLGIMVEQWRSERAAFWSAWIGVAVFVPSFFAWNPKGAFVVSVIAAFLAFAAVCRWFREPKTEPIVLQGAFETVCVPAEPERPDGETGKKQS